jgi:hypothetical protein
MAACLALCVAKSTSSVSFVDVIAEQANVPLIHRQAECGMLVSSWRARVVFAAAWKSDHQ